MKETDATRYGNTKSPKPPNVALQVFVHTPTNDIISFNSIQPNAKIYDLKSQLELKTGILAELQNVYLSTIKLDDSKTFGELKLKNGGVLRVKIKEKSLEQIYINAIEGNLDAVFSFGVQFIHEDEANNDEDDVIGTDSWNKFVPLRAFQALFAASFKGHLQLMSELLSKSAANLLMLSKSHRSCLHIAASQGELHTVSYLLAQGVDTSVLDKEGLSALALAASNGYTQCEKRIWLFNWNLDVMNKLEEKKKNGKEKKKIKELNEIAERYQNEYKRSRSTANETLFPPIPLDKRKPQQHQTFLKQGKSRAEKSLLPRLQDRIQTHHSQKPQSSKENMTNLVDLTRQRDDTIKIHRKTKSAPQVKIFEKSRLNKWNNRVNGWIDETNLHALKVKPTRISYESQLDAESLNEKSIDAQSTTSSETNKNNDLETNSPNLTSADTKKYWNVRASKVKEPIEKKVLPIRILQNADLKSDMASQKRIVIKCNTEKIKRRGVKEEPLQELTQSFDTELGISERHSPKPQSNSHVIQLPCMSPIIIPDVMSPTIIPDDNIDLGERSPGDGSSSPYLLKKRAYTSDERGKYGNTIQTGLYYDKNHKETTPTVSVGTEDSAVSVGTEESASPKVHDVRQPPLSVSLETTIKEIGLRNSHVTEDSMSETTNSTLSEITIDLWRPNSSLSISTNETPAFIKRRYKTHGDWLKDKKKRRCKSTPVAIKTQTTDKPNYKSEESKQAYEKWLNTKARRRTKSANEHDTKLQKNLKRTVSESSVAYKKWLEKKRQLRLQSSLENKSKRSSRNQNRKGVSFEKWLESKKEQQRTLRVHYMLTENENTTTKQKSSGVPFERWVEQKIEERKLLNVLDKTKKAQEEQMKFDNFKSRWNDPHLKTFEEWYLEKLYDQKLSKKQNKQKQTKQKQHPEDSNLIFDMWLNEKYMKEMEEEKTKLNEVQNVNQYDFLNSDSSDNDSETYSSKPVTTQNYKGLRIINIKETTQDHDNNNTTQKDETIFSDGKIENDEPMEIESVKGSHYETLSTSDNNTDSESDNTDTESNNTINDSSGDEDSIVHEALTNQNKDKSTDVESEKVEQSTDSENDSDEETENKSIVETSERNYDSTSECRETNEKQTKAETVESDGELKRENLVKSEVDLSDTDTESDSESDDDTSVDSNKERNASEVGNGTADIIAEGGIDDKKDYSESEVESSSVVSSNDEEKINNHKDINGDLDYDTSQSTSETYNLKTQACENEDEHNEVEISEPNGDIACDIKNTTDTEETFNKDDEITNNETINENDELDKEDDGKNTTDTKESFDMEDKITNNETIQTGFSDNSNAETDEVETSESESDSDKDDDVKKNNDTEDIYDKEDRIANNETINENNEDNDAVESSDERVDKIANNGEINENNEEEETSGPDSEKDDDEVKKTNDAEDTYEKVDGISNNEDVNENNGDKDEVETSEPDSDIDDDVKNTTDTVDTQDEITNNGTIQTRLSENNEKNEEEKTTESDSDKDDDRNNTTDTEETLDMEDKITNNNSISKNNEENDELKISESEHDSDNDDDNSEVTTNASGSTLKSQDNGPTIQAPISEKTDATLEKESSTAELVENDDADEDDSETTNETMKNSLKREDKTKDNENGEAHENIDDDDDESTENDVGDLSSDSSDDETELEDLESDKGNKK